MSKEHNTNNTVVVGLREGVRGMGSSSMRTIFCRDGSGIIDRRTKKRRKNKEKRQKLIASYCRCIILL